MGSSTAILYFTTAYYSIFAPKVSGTPTRGSIRLHKALALIHGPGMILTPVERIARGNEIIARGYYTVPWYTLGDQKCTGWGF